MIFSSLLSVLERGDTVDIVTVIDAASSSVRGKMVMIYKDGTIEGQLDDGVTAQILDKVRVMTWSKPEVFSLVDVTGETYRLFWDRVSNRASAVVFGGGHISQPVVQMLSLLDFSVTVIDDRLEFANQERFPSAERVICENFSQSFTQVNIDSNTAVIIVTRGHRYDMECLRAMMYSNARYFGRIGSKRRVKEVLQLLSEEGAPENLAQRLKAPIGLDIKAETPAEIAVSIVAEVIAVFRGSRLGWSQRDHQEVR